MGEQRQNSIVKLDLLAMFIIEILFDYWDVPKKDQSYFLFTSSWKKEVSTDFYTVCVP